MDWGVQINHALLLWISFNPQHKCKVHVPRMQPVLSSPDFYICLSTQSIRKRANARKLLSYLNVDFLQIYFKKSVRFEIEEQAPHSSPISKLHYNQDNGAVQLVRKNRSLAEHWILCSRNAHLDACNDQQRLVGKCESRVITRAEPCPLSLGLSC